MSGSLTESHDGSGRDSVPAWGGESVVCLDLPPPRRRLLPGPVCGAWETPHPWGSPDVPGPGRLSGGRDSLESQNCGLDRAGHGERSLGWACGPIAAVPALASVAILRTRLRRGPAKRVRSDRARRAAGQCRTHDPTAGCLVVVPRPGPPDGVGMELLGSGAAVSSSPRLWAGRAQPPRAPSEAAVQCSGCP